MYDTIQKVPLSYLFFMWGLTSQSFKQLLCRTKPQLAHDTCTSVNIPDRWICRLTPSHSYLVISGSSFHKHPASPFSPPASDSPCINAHYFTYHLVKFWVLFSFFNLWGNRVLEQYIDLGKMLCMYYPCICYMCLSCAHKR